MLFEDSHLLASARQVGGAHEPGDTRPDHGDVYVVPCHRRFLRGFRKRAGPALYRSFSTPELASTSSTGQGSGIVAPARWPAGMR